MKSETSGIVIEVDGDIAKVRASRHGDCENCGACPGSGAAIITVKNTLGAKPGQKVVFEMEQTNMLRAAFIVYILPLIGILIGVILGTAIASATGGNRKIFQIAGALIVFVLSLIYVKAFDKSAGKNKSMKPVIKYIV